MNLLDIYLFTLKYYPKSISEAIEIVKIKHLTLVIGLAAFGARALEYETADLLGK